MKKIHLSWEDVRARAETVARFIDQSYSTDVELCLYPVPRGGIPAALLVQTAMAERKSPIHLEIVNDPSRASIVIDDVIDSGATRGKFPGRCFLALYDKTAGDSGWLVFPWETKEEVDGPTENVRRLIEFIGDDPNRDGLKETPARVIRSYGELFSGYKQNPADVMKVFEIGTYDQLVVLKNCEFFSHCEHHMSPFFGKAHIAYLPDKMVIGISKLARLLEIYSRRLQIQERIGQQVVDAIMEHLKPLGAGCVLSGKHHCMCARGVQKQNSIMVTSSLAGCFREPHVKAEFFGMIQHGDM